jgi:ubiquinol-cytochrome c reductase cytochrome c1 subunit
MIRWISALVGLAFVFVVSLGLFSSVVGVITDPAPPTAEHFVHEEHPLLDAELPSSSIVGKFDLRQVQRGFQVYKEVCSACHSLRLVAFRDLKQIGYDDGQVKALASGWQIEQPSVNPDTGEPATRKNTPADHFPLVYPNDVAARAANNNAVPPDLSLMTKARHDGPDYVYSLVGHGYVPQPADLLSKFPDAKTPKGLYYNQYFANLNIAMPPPLKSEGQVQYLDGTKPTVDQMAKDVAAFLTWTAEPNLDARHGAGFAVLGFLLVFCVLAWGAYQNVWRDLKH